MLSRDEFLAKAWRRYPEATSGWLDVSAYLEAPQVGAIVCGRLGAGDTLSFGGSRVRFELKAAKWLEPQSVPFSSTLLAEGDLIAARVAETGDPTIFDRMLLLAPGGPAALGDFTVGRSKEWMAFVATIRSHFTSRDFIEATTPTLVPSPGTEPFLDPFVTTWEIGSERRDLYLPTSPEFHLKKMLAAGWPRLFELKTCFRNGEIGIHHQPEFLMLEWYRAFATLDRIADDVEELFGTLSRAFGTSIPRLERTTVSRLFERAFPGFVLKPSTTREELADLAKRESIPISSDDGFDDVFFRLFLEKIEPTLGVSGPLLVRGYPPSQAALSRLGADGFADRFEVYWRGLEIANAFHELNDPGENEARFAIDAAKKASLGKPAVPRDETLVRAIHRGLPPSGGIALGVDRLFMALLGVEDIAATRAFPIVR